jgi:hypothetical protein
VIGDRGRHLTRVDFLPFDGFVGHGDAGTPFKCMFLRLSVCKGQGGGGGPFKGRIFRFDCVDTDTEMRELSGYAILLTSDLFLK